MSIKRTENVGHIERRIERIDVLDHGYVSIVESWGSEERIIEAARMSTGKGFLGWGIDVCKQCSGTGKYKERIIIWDEEPVQVRLDSRRMQLVGKHHTETVEYNCACVNTNKAGDEKLLRYLYEHKHATPFEMAGLVVEVQAPIFVFSEWHRHRTQSYNEMSARYTPLPDLNYVPSIERLLVNSKSNKQAGTVKDAEELNEAKAESYQIELRNEYKSQERLYQVALSMGVPKELARIHLPVGRYSRMRASANLRNWLAFLTLRMDSAAQFEIRQYANAVHGILSNLFPRTLELFDEGQKIG